MNPRLALIPLLLSAACASAEAPRALQPAQESSASWFRQGALRAQSLGAGQTPARNLILFVGDGMSLTTVAAARILEGQQRGESGEENALAFEVFPHTALSKTYNTDSQTPDSAATMTAMTTGAKTRIGMVGVGLEARRGDCGASLRAPLANIIQMAAQAGLGTGIVTTTRLTHATPAASFGHSPDRNWESDTDLPPEALKAGCRDLARQLIEFPYGDGVDVLLGGGRRKFLPATETDPEYPEYVGDRLDGRNLVAEWQQRHPQGAYVWNRAQFEALAPTATGKLLGIFEPDHMQFEHDRPQDRAGEPSLAEMTRKAIALLSQRESGYVLIVEGGRIDHAHHYGNAYRALTDTIAFSDAVRAARQATSEDDTLILVTADHSHVLNLVGYPSRGNAILGKVHGSSGEDDGEELVLDALGLPFTTLVYANGPGYAGASLRQGAGPKRYPHYPMQVQPYTGRPDLREVDTEHPDYLQESLVPLTAETHGGDDVGIWASGPGAAAVRGTVEQNVIFHLLAQSQPRLRALLCEVGACEGEVPVALPSIERLRRGGKGD